MRKYQQMLAYELKNLLKDKINLFMLLYPFLMILIMGILIPNFLQNSDEISRASAYGIIFMITLSMGFFVGGILLGFSLIEGKDEKTFNNIAVTPLSLNGYVAFKAVYCTVLSVISNLVLIYGLKAVAAGDYITHTSLGIRPIFDMLSHLEIITYAVISALFTPALGLIFGAFARNKVEGLVIMKSGGLFIMLPLLMLLPTFQGIRQYYLSMFPNFWSLKGLYTIMIIDPSSANLDFYLYQLIGALFCILVCILCFKVFKKKLQITT